MNSNNIRNFSIIAHIDHGKSTLADRFLEFTHTVPKDQMKEQLLDKMDIERERGITIKLAPVQMLYTKDGIEYTLNLIDTPGHVDFSYEVSRSLAAVEGTILLVDATQGVEAQTLAHLYQAIEHNLTIIPVLNKIDLPSSDPNRVEKEVRGILGISESEEILRVSAKTGEGVEAILNEIIQKVPAPKNSILSPTSPAGGSTRALIFDSYYDSYQGVIAYVRIVDGELKKGDSVKLIASGKNFQILDLGFLKPVFSSQKILNNGQIGYIVTGLKDISVCRVGDTIGLANEEVEALAGYKESQPMVFAGFYSSSGEDYVELRESLGKLKLNDAALTFEPDNSPALGFGFRLGFLGMLHMEIVKERLEREYGLDLIVTSPSVSYELVSKNHGTKVINSAMQVDDLADTFEIKEPWAKLEIISPTQYIGTIMEFVQSKRAIYKKTDYLDTRVLLYYEMPMSEIILHFYDGLKSVSSGYASMNYEFLEYRAENLKRLDLVISGDRIDALAEIVHQNNLTRRARELTAKLKELIPRQMFDVKIQAGTGITKQGQGHILASESISAARKDVTAKLYGGDVTRKNKLLDKQKKGKKKMKKLGRVDIPSDVFINLLKN
ncbi:MAG: translation elongation factor 4 [Patescibacteria group bacterium]